MDVRVPVPDGDVGVNAVRPIPGEPVGKNLELNPASA